MSEELIYWIVTLSFLLIVGVLMLWHLNSCPHTWKKIESGTVHSKQYHLEDWRQTGYIQFTNVYIVKN